jgi:L-alanine-DL-glutamate epimerase-like enolase superfamily enzyme
MWLEDMLMPGNFTQYRELANATSLPLIAWEASCNSSSSSPLAP